MSWTVFYAWQSDRPNNTNRGLIQRALEEGIAEVRSDGNLVFDPRLDKDTLDVPGSPDIEATIFAKIAQAAVFVADVTLVTADGSERPSPNPNVLVELGYALHALGPERVVMIMNTAFGRPESLPFDIRRKRTVTYQVTEDTPEKSAERRRLEKVIVEALRASLKVAEGARSKEPVPPSNTDQFIAAIEQNLPAQRAYGRRYVDEVLEALDRLSPPSGRDDDALVAAIHASAPIVSQFARVAQTMASYDSGEAIEAIIRLFEQILRRHEPRDGFTGSFHRTDFDLFKFVGHELFVVLVAALLEERRWKTLESLLCHAFLIAGTVREEKTVTFEEFSQPTNLLDEVRRDKMRQPNGATRTSIHADLLQDRYSSGTLSEQVTWDQFRAADFFLYLRSKLKPGASSWGLWIPWTALFLTALPEFIRRAEVKTYAEVLAKTLGLSGLDGFGGKLGKATFGIKEVFSSMWRAPGEHYDWSKIASR